ncbi:HIT family protein [Sporanaerobium hydrogeniformans]|uniref:HIT family protein n=1 Tax=Sporanaerobium hydrogeniformans TaxID=3072179 RepID=A0AC61DB36_9FIRM|nr:HIT family protein [Sporanaerobium hydrogeniformans]PHV70085.1 HIT family protein [Sporanaerobium hydrogeniformans]
MSFDNTCFYCAKDERLDNLMLEICELDASTVYLFKEQTYRGRCLLAYKGHVNELFELSDEQRNAFMKDVARVAKAMKEAFGAHKINYGAYSDKLPHLHFHLIPKYEDGPGFGGTFEMMPDPKVLLSDAEYATLIEKVKAHL